MEPAQPRRLEKKNMGCLRLEDDLDATVLLVAERLVKFRRIGECCTVGDQEGRVDVALFDVLQQCRCMLQHMGLTHLERQSLTEGSPDGKFVDDPGIDPGVSTGRHPSECT